MVGSAVGLSSVGLGGALALALGARGGVEVVVGHSVADNLLHGLRAVGPGYRVGCPKPRLVVLLLPLLAQAHRFWLLVRRRVLRRQLGQD